MPDTAGDVPEERRAGQLSRSWLANAEAWTRAVREDRIESRRVATARAIIEAVAGREPGSVLDVGCGEGWLCRALAESGVRCVGVDASEPLVAAAREGGGGAFHHLSYDEITARPGQLGGPFDVVACNFALLEEHPAPLLGVLRTLLAPGGALVIQTVHPWAVRGDLPYRDGWRTETFATMGDGFTEPMPWFYRTLESWLRLARESGYRVDDLREPAHPDTGEPLSLLLTLVSAW